MNNGDMPAMPLALETRIDEFGAVAINDAYEGMSKRELIAMHAMQGEIMATGNHQRPSPEDVAQFAVKCADALLKELDKPVREG